MPLPNDPLLGLQWYLKNTGQAGGTAGIDINVENVWTDYTGTGIRIGIYDDGVQVDHPDLQANYLASLQPVIGGVVHAGVPITAGNNHGTPVAGIIVASGNNNTGVVGVAYGASFGTARFLGAEGQLGQQLMDLQTNFDVTNHSWGSTRTYFADGNGNEFWQSSANTGRGGLGVIMVKAAGNERVGVPGGDEPVGRDANDSGANTNRYAIVVGATLNTGFVADYSSPGAVLLVSAPAGPSATGLDQDISTDRTGTDGYNNGTTGTPTNQADYAAFNGTSAATPVTSGVAALILQANNTLGWRDVQEILAYSARKVGSAIGAQPTGSEADVWAYNAAKDWNGGGLHFSNDYGFGMVDALTAVRLAETWRIGSPTANTSANEQTATATVTQAAQAIPDNTGASITYTFNITGAISIESASINLALNHTAVGDLRIILTSPNGTASDVWRGTNAGTAINTDWSFASREFYGDSANGTWTVTITDSGALGTGTVGNATLTLYGSTKTADDTYIYTNEFAGISGLGTRNTLTDTGGIDTLNAAAVTAAMNINLTAGAQSQIAGQTLSIAAGTTIENAVGGDGNDTVTGNALANILSGARGNDTLNGGAGNDTLSGGAGDDTVYFDAADSAANVTGGAGIDTLFVANTITTTPLSFNLNAQGFEKVQRDEIDTGNQFTWGTRTTFHDNNWVRTSEVGVLDTPADLGDSYNYNWTNGVLTNFIYYDTAVNDKAFQNYTISYNPAGQQISVVGLYDNTNTYTTSNDLANLAWTFVTANFNAAGQALYSNTTYDNGDNAVANYIAGKLDSSTVYDGAANNHAYQHYTVNFNASGVAFAVSGLNDNGTTFSYLV